MGYNTLANFRIEKKIGRGQFSEVYRATCLLDGVPVALKKVQVRMALLLVHVKYKPSSNSLVLKSIQLNLKGLRCLDVTLLNF